MLTASFVGEVAVVLCSVAIDLLHLLIFTTFVEVLDDDADEHVEHEKADKQQERDEVDEAPLVVIHLRLQHHANNITKHILYRSTGRL